MKRHRRRPPTPWRKQGNKHAARLQELQRRVLADLEDCRLAWAEREDPLALIVGAVKCSEAGMFPEWLADPLLVALWSTVNWRRREAQATDGARAAGVLTALTDSDSTRTWEEAYLTGQQLAHEHFGATVVGPDATKASLDRVRGGLSSAGAYWQAELGWGARLKLALARLSPDHRRVLGIDPQPTSD